VTQGIANVRDKFKSTGRMLVLLCPDIRLPAELMNDVIILDVPLPDREELGNVVAGTHVAAQVKVPEQDGLSRAVDALCGLSRFTAEQVTAMSLRKAGLDLEEMWDRKRTIIQQVGGLQVEKRRVRFDDLGGLFQVKEFARLIINGKRRPKLVVLVDEIDRQLSGINDSSGVGGDAYQQLLSNLQDRGWQGILFPGFGGTGKTELGNAIGTEAGGLFLKFDMGGMQDKFVGESQRKVRAAMEMLWAMGGEDVLFVGTTNNAQAIRPELLRRFNLGQWFYDLPTAEEQAPIWDIYLKRFEVPEQEKPECHEWTGAEIRKVCELSWMLGVSLKEASRFITPICKSMGDQVKAMREQASGKYLSASGGGLYKVKKTGVSVDTIRQFTKPASGSN
jgi:SpoVK/Ycf46/Vps4 family AAA+-type ATPase